MASNRESIYNAGKGGAPTTRPPAPTPSAVLLHATLALTGGLRCHNFVSVRFFATFERFEETHAMRNVLVAAAALVACAGPASAVRVPVSVPHCLPLLPLTALSLPAAPPAPGPEHRQRRPVFRPSSARPRPWYAQPRRRFAPARGMCHRAFHACSIFTRTHHALTPSCASPLPLYTHQGRARRRRPQARGPWSPQSHHRPARRAPPRLKAGAARRRRHRRLKGTRSSSKHSRSSSRRLRPRRRLSLQHKWLHKSSFSSSRRRCRRSWLKSRCSSSRRPRRCKCRCSRRRWLRRSKLG